MYQPSLMVFRAFKRTSNTAVHLDPLNQTKNMLLIILQFLNLFVACFGGPLDHYQVTNESIGVV